MKQREVLEFELNGEKYPVCLDISQYLVGGLYISLLTPDGELWGDVTINLAGILVPPLYHAYISSNFSEETIRFLKKYNIAKVVDKRNYNMGTYTLCEFNKDRLMELSPDGVYLYEFYCNDTPLPCDEWYLYNANEYYCGIFHRKADATTEMTKGNYELTFIHPVLNPDFFIPRYFKEIMEEEKVSGYPGIVDDDVIYIDTDDGPKYYLVENVNENIYTEVNFISN